MSARLVKHDPACPVCHGCPPWLPFGPGAVQMECVRCRYPSAPDEVNEAAAMSAMRDALAQYLVATAVAVKRPGSGHATGEQVADTVMVFLSEWEDGDPCLPMKSTRSRHDAR